MFHLFLYEIHIRAFKYSVIPETKFFMPDYAKTKIEAKHNARVI